MLKLVVALAMIVVALSLIALFSYIHRLERQVLSAHQQIGDILELLKSQNKICELRHNNITPIRDINFPNSEVK